VESAETEALRALVREWKDELGRLVRRLEELNN